MAEGSGASKSLADHWLGDQPPPRQLGTATSLPMGTGPGGLQATVWLSFLH